MLKPLDIDALIHDRLANPEYAREYVKALGEEYREAYAAFNAEIANLREDIARHVERDTERLEGLECERRLAIRHTALLSIYREALKTISENADCGGPWCAARAGVALSQGKETT